MFHWLQRHIKMQQAVANPNPEKAAANQKPRGESSRPWCTSEALKSKIHLLQ
jgi:hypothetical protein